MIDGIPDLSKQVVNRIKRDKYKRDKDQYNRYHNKIDEESEFIAVDEDSLNDFDNEIEGLL